MLQVNHLASFGRPWVTVLYLALFVFCFEATSFSFKTDAQDTKDWKIKELLSTMSLREKARQLDMYRGSDFLENGLFSANKTLSIISNMSIGAIHDLYPPTADIINDIQAIVMENTESQVPILFLEECLHGLNGNGKTIFPQSIGLSSTWDVDLLERIGSAIGSETRAYGIGLCLSPVLGVSRDPRWGRTQETYGEDTYLNSKIGVAMIQGLQGFSKGGLSSNQSVISNPKHFAAHSIPEAGHNIAPAHVGERELLEVFLPVFKAAVQDGQCLGLLAAYSEIDGIPNCANEELLTSRLRDEWGYSGLVVSDLGAINMLYELHKVVASQSEAILVFLMAGGNMQFYDFSHEFFQDTIIDLVESGALPLSVLDSRVADVLNLKFELGLMSNWYTADGLVESHVNSKENQDLALEAALKSVVLLKNEDNILPLSIANGISSIAVIGPNADVMRFGDYSGEGVLSNFVTVLEGIRNIVGDKIEVRQAWGSNVDVINEMQPIRPFYLRPDTIQCGEEKRLSDDEERGLLGEYYDNWNLEGEPTIRRIDEMVFFNWYYYGPDNILNRVNSSEFSVRWTGFIVPSITVFQAFISAQTNGDGVRLWLNDSLLIDTWTNQSNPSIAQVDWEGGRRYKVQMEYFRNQSTEVTLGWNLVGDNPIADAVLCALSSDIVIAVLGDYQEDDGEGLDEALLDLPGNQEELIEELIATDVPVVVVLINGRPLSTTFIAANASAIIEAWYPGQAAGTAIASILFGSYNPGGRLPITIPATVGQLPVFYNYKPSSRRTNYVDQSRLPLYPFGFGLSYTTFQYSNMVVDPPIIGVDGQTTVTVQVKNNGTMWGDEVVQLYVRDEVASVTTPVISLKGFLRVRLEVNEERNVSFVLVAEKDLFVVDKHFNSIVEPGNFTLFIAKSASDFLFNSTLSILPSSS